MWAINYLDVEEPDAVEALSWVEEAGTRGFGIPGDLTRSDTCRRVVDEAVSRLGGLDILVNNAGSTTAATTPGPSGYLTEELVNRVLRTNLLAPLWLCQAALPHLGEGSCISTPARSLASPGEGHAVGPASAAGVADVASRILAEGVAAGRGAEDVGLVIEDVTGRRIVRIHLHPADRALNRVGHGSSFGGDGCNTRSGTTPNVRPRPSARPRCPVQAST